MVTLIKTTSTTYTYSEGKAERTVPRVSRVLDAYFPVPWTEEARERGSEVHKAIALLDSPGGLYWPSVWPEIVPYLRAWEKFKAEVVSRPHGYSLLVDVKSGVSHTRHQLQTAAYKLALVEMWGVMFKGPLSETFVAHCLYGYAGTLDRFYPGIGKGARTVRRACVYVKKSGDYQLDWHDDPLDEAAWVGYVHGWYWSQKYGKERR